MEVELYGTRVLTLEEKMSSLLSSFHILSLSSLLQVMRETGVIISGSFVLAVLHPGQFMPNDMDFYVTPFGFASVLLFAGKNGYTLVPSKESTRKYDPDLVVMELEHSTSFKRINVITGFESHVVKFITRFHSTLVMNYVSWFGLVSLYPDWTLNKRGLIVEDTVTNERCFAKYEERGYFLGRGLDELGHTSRHDCDNDLYCPSSVRKLDDGRCLLETFGFYEANDLKKLEAPFEWSLQIPCPFSDEH